MAIEDLNRGVGSVVTGQYRATSCKERRKGDGQRFQILQLDDATGSINAMVWPSAKAIGLLPVMPCYVEVKGKPRWFNGELILDVHQLRRIEVEEIEPGNLLLPKRLCPDVAVPALRDLTEFLGMISSAELQGFVSRVLHDEVVVESFLRSPGSRRRHHAYAGGLLVHSAGPLGLVTTMAEEFFQDDSDAIELTQVAYLFHDLGKVLSLKPTRHEKTMYLRHEFLTGQILGPHLAWLNATAPKLAWALSYIFDFIDQPQGNRRRAEFAGADVVVWVDQHNASLVAGRGLDGNEAPAPLREPLFEVKENRHVAR